MRAQVIFGGASTCVPSSKFANPDGFPYSLDEIWTSPVTYCNEVSGEVSGEARNGRLLHIFHKRPF
jgi:hypothetical protein